MLRSWCTLHRPDMLGCLWMAVLLGSLTWLDFRDGGIFLIPPFAATLTILVYQPNVSIAQPIAVVGGSLLGAAIGTVLSVLVGFGPGVALLAALTAMIMLPLLRLFHPPGVALATCPALLHCGAMVCDSGRAAIHACRGDLLRGAEPLGQHLAAIPRSFLGCVSDQSRISCVEKRRVDAEA